MATFNSALFQQFIDTDRLHLSDYEQEYFKRAVAALYRHSERPQQPGQADSGFEVHDGKAYMVLRNINGILAVYRVRKYDGVLKRLLRWPAELES